MVHTSFATWERFSFQRGHGIVLPSGEALMVIGVGGRTGFYVKKGPIPEEAIPGNPKIREVVMMLIAVEIAMK